IVAFRNRDVEARLAEYGSQSLGLAALKKLQEYFIALDTALRSIRLTEGEAMLIADALNGTLMDETNAYLLGAEIDDSLEDGLAEKWNVDGRALVARLRELSLIQCLAILDAI